MDLFEHAARVSTAERLRDRGMARAADAQDRAVIGWSELAYLAILNVARMQETVHTDDVRAIFPHEPDHPNAFGAVWLRAIRDGVIERTGTVRASTDPRKHSHQYPIYRSLTFVGRRQSAA